MSNETNDASKMDLSRRNVLKVAVAGLLIRPGQNIFVGIQFFGKDNRAVLHTRRKWSGAKRFGYRGNLSAFNYSGWRCRLGRKCKNCTKRCISVGA